MNEALADGVHAMVPRETMAPGARKLRDVYERKPGAPFYQKEFGFYCLERWKEQGMPADAEPAELFGYDQPAIVSLGQLGWCEAAFDPCFEERVVEDRGQHEVVQDTAGRHVLFFKGRRSGFMPEYIGHPVSNMRSWEDDCKWRLDPATAERYSDLGARMAKAVESAGRGMIVVQNIVGAYMYLRSLIGPGEVLLKFYDEPGLIHDCMKTWLALADAVTARHQQSVTIDALYFGEDICYNHGPLISPDMMREFIIPYYRQLIANTRGRQIDRTRHLFFHIDSDGFVDPVIPLYREIGMDVMDPFEVAAGCDVVRTGREYPDLVIGGGVDKRVLATGRDAIDRMVDRIFPAMRERGGYTPTCDHGVPEEVPYKDYLHYRKRCLEFA
ncbi:uroporphyrinogen decarboxylase family protein [Verrucomicrobiota bacterium]